MCLKATIQTECPVSGEPIQLNVGVDGPEPGMPGVIHFAVPASRWWNDIIYT